MRKNRAQIFQSFDALKGFREILSEQERVVVDKKILSEYDLEILDRKIHYVKIGMIIKVIYFDNGQYVMIEGVVSKLNLDTRIIQIVKTKINLRDIVDIQIDEYDDVYE